MELKEFLAIRSAFHAVNQHYHNEISLNIMEFSLLTFLARNPKGVQISKLAKEQHTMRATLTHRISQLEKKNLCVRKKNPHDHRIVFCTITSQGIEIVERFCNRMIKILSRGSVLSRITPERLSFYFDAMASFVPNSQDLCLLGLLSASHTVSINELVDIVGLLQPTVSMAVINLEKEGLVQRTPGADTRFVQVELTQAGVARAGTLKEQVGELMVHRKSKVVLLG